MKRFSSRVEHYIKHRPRYPQYALEFLQWELNLQSSSVIADIGSGSGISSELFLAAGNKVFGIEPNAEMRQAAEKYLSAYPDFHSMDGKAEETGLPDHSVDFIVAGQAFHWFDRQACKLEFLRILRSRGWVVLLWNDRRQDTSFANAYENFLKTYAIDYDVVDHRNITKEALKEFFGGKSFHFKMFDNEQVFDFEGLKGRVLSCSYMPMEGHTNFQDMIDALKILFQRFQQNGTIRMGYNTLMYYGRFS
ncbi:class I SAM-dependent methyltransferase [bacterium]|nr:class I SAM-dependent methyltransferase [bacterium]